MAGNEVEIVVTSRDKSGPGITGATENVSKFRKSMRDGGKDAKEYGGHIDKLADKTDNSERNLIGLHDVVDGTAAIMAGPGKQGMVAYIQGWADLAGGVTPLIESLKVVSKETIKNAVSSIRAAVASGVERGAKLAGAAATWAMTIAQRALNLAMRANPIGIIITVLVLLVAGIIYAYKHSETFRRIVQGLWQELKMAIGWVVGLGKAIKDAFVKAITWLEGAGRSIITGLWNGLKAVWKSTIDWFKDLPSKILGALGIHSPPDWAISAGRHVMGGILKGLLHGSTDLLGFAKGLPGRLGNLMGSVLGTPSSVTGGALGDWIKQAMAILGLPGPWFDPIMRRVMFESGGNPNAQNNWDINAQRGDPSRGLMQTIGATFRAFALPGLGGIFNPVANLVAALRYIIARYGSIFAIDPPVRGYAGGTAYVPRTGLAMLHRGEAVLTAAENRGRGGGITLEIHPGGSELDAVFIAWLRKAVRVKGGGNVQVAFGS